MLKIDKMTGGYRNIPVLKEISFAVPDGQWGRKINNH